MYINLTMLNKKGIDPTTLVILQGFKQQASMDDVEAGVLNPEGQEKHDWVAERCKKLEDDGYLVKYKTKRGYRTTKKAAALLRDVQIADVTDEVKSIYVDIVNLYKEFGRESRITRGDGGLKNLSWLLSVRGDVIGRDEIIRATEEMLISKGKDPDKFVPQLDNWIHKPENLFSTTKKLEWSRLYQTASRYANS